MDQFFTEGQYTQPQQPVLYTQSQQPVLYTQHNDAQQNEWQQAESPSNTFQSSPSYNMDTQLNYSSNVVASIGSSTAIQVDSEVTRKIAQDQERINQILKQKNAKEYQEKQTRKNAGRQQLQTFFAQKQKELDERKQHNLEHQKQVVEKARELTSKAGWGKVFENVNLKQGEHQGTKSTNRMRESIVNKCEDERQHK